MNEPPSENPHHRARLFTIKYLKEMELEAKRQGKTFRVIALREAVAELETRDLNLTLEGK